jgi:hypothetical protein
VRARVPIRRLAALRAKIAQVNRDYRRFGAEPGWSVQSVCFVALNAHGNEDRHPSRCDAKAYRGPVGMSGVTL